MIHSITSLSQNIKKAILLAHDGMAMLFGLWLALSLRYEILYVPHSKVWLLFLITPFIGWAIFIKFGLYRAIIRYISAKAMSTVLLAVTLFILVWSIIVLMLNLGTHAIPRSVPFIYWMICLLFIGGSRWFARWVFANFKTTPQPLKKTLIYGAGQAGRQLSMSLNQSDEFNHVAFIDDDPRTSGMQINGRYVYDFKKIQTLINKYAISDIILAMPSVSRRKRREIKEKLNVFDIGVEEMPSIEKIAGGKLQINDIQNIDIYDLLDREMIHAKDELLSKNIKDKVVLVTGAGGSIGSEICRQAVAQQARIIILFELNEYALYTIEQELLNTETIVIPILGNMQHKEQVSSLCALHGVQTIYHAAAYKHVPLVEANAYEGLTNNVLGTLSVAQAAQENNIEVMVLISTDKAVRPTNIMGATKRFAELVLQAFSEKNQNNTVFTMVRFGNVLGSSGSVIPKFKSQIKQGGPLTVTHSEMTRFFMMTPEAVELVIQAGAMAKGGEVFVLDMGQPVNIMHLAKRMIVLSGLAVQDQENLDGDIQIDIVGLRPGEKLYEELLIGDTDTPTEHDRILKASEHSLSWEELLSYLERIPHTKNKPDIKLLLKEVVKEYTPDK